MCLWDLLAAWMVVETGVGIDEGRDEVFVEGVKRLQPAPRGQRDAVGHSRIRGHNYVLMPRCQRL